MAVTRIKNNQITDASAGNTQLGINANTKVQDYSVTSTKLANNLTYGSDLTISGNLSVTGTTTAVDTTYTNIQDPLIVLADGQTAGAPTVDIGYIGLRGSSANIASFWNEANSTFAVAYTNSGMTDNTVIAINSYADFKANNINTVTDISAGGNVNANNVNVTNNASITGNVTVVGNVSGGNINGGYFYGVDLSLSGAVTATVGVQAGNLYTANTVSAGGNIYGANFATTGAQGNITGANVISGVTLTASGNVNTAGNVNANNVTVGNIVSATGNIVTGNFFVGDGYYISNINAGNVAATKIFNGGSYANIAATDGNLVVAVGAGSNVVATFYDTGVDINGNASVSGNVIAQANVSGGNINATTDVSAGANVVGGNVLTNGVVSAGSTITGGNIDAGTGFISTTGAVSGGNVYATTNVTAGGNVDANNVNVTNAVSAGGNIYAANFATTGSGGNISGANVISSVTVTTTGSIYAGTNVSAGGNVFATDNVSAGGNIFATNNVSAGGNVEANAISALNNGAISTGGNVIGGNVLSNGVLSATGTANVGNLVTNGFISSTGNVQFGNILTGGQVSASGNVTGNVLVGSYAQVTYTANVGNVSTQGFVTAVGNVESGNILTGGQVSATGQVTGGNVSAVGNVDAGNVNATIVYANVSASGNVLAGNLVSDYLYSAGGALTISAVGTNNGISILTNGTGNIGVGSTYINNLADPQQAQDAATKYYVDTTAQGLHVHPPANVATTADLETTFPGGTVTYTQPGPQGVGATLTITGNTFTVIDTVTLTANMRILVKNESNAVYNGVYTYSNSTALTRSTDMDQDSELAGGDFLFIESGNVNADTQWVQTTDNVVIGTSNISFSQFGGAGTYQQGNGIAINGTVISTRINTGNLQYDGSGNLQVSSSAQFTTPNLGSATGSQISVTGNVNASVIGAVEISASGNVYAAEISSAGNVVAVANVTGGNLLTGNIISAGGNITGGNLITGGYLSVAANVFAGNLSLAGNVFSDINMLGNITAGGYITAVGNVSGGNVNTGIVSASGNVYSANVFATGDIIPTAGNTYTLGNSTNSWSSLYVSGSTIYLGGIQLKQTATNTLSVTTSNGTTPADFSIDNISAGGNVLAGNVSTTADVSATGNVYGNNISATANVLGGNVNVTTDVSAGGNVKANAVLVLNNGAISTGGNVSGANVNVTTNVSAGGNVEANAVSALNNGAISTGGNVYGANVLATTISASGNVNANNVTVGNIVSATGNIVTGNYFVGDGYYISNINPGNVAATKITNGDSYANVTTSNGNVTIGVNGNLVATFYDTGISSTGNVNVDGLTIAIGQSIVGTTANANIVVQANGTGNVLVQNAANSRLVIESTGSNVQNGVFVNTTGTNLGIGGGGVFAGSYILGNGTPTQSQNRLAAFIGQGSVDGTTTASPSAVKITLDAAGNWSAGNTPAHISLWTTASGTSTSAETVRAESGGNLTVFAGSLNAANGNVNTTSVNATGLVSVTGNVIAGNISTGGQISATGNVTVDTFMYVDPVDATVSIGNSSIVACSVLSLNTTTSFVVPVGNTAQRPSTTYTGMVRFNTSQNNLEIYDNAQWAPVGSTAFTVIADQQFNGDGTTVNFTLNSTQTTNSCIVSINGVVQIPTLAYAVSGTNPTCVLTFTEAPANGDVIDVRQITTTVTLSQLDNVSGNAIVAVSDTAAQVNITGNLVTTVNSVAPTLSTNKTLSFQLVSDTSLKILVRGSDGTTRSATLTLS